MVRRHAAEFPSLPSEIATEARRAADAQRTMALALAPSIGDEEFEAYRQRILTQVDNGSAARDRDPDCAATVNREAAADPASLDLVARMTALADRATADCARAAQRAQATTDLLGRALFVALQEPPRSQSGRSDWKPSYSFVRSGK